MTALVIAAGAFSLLCMALAFASYLIDHRRSARHVEAEQPAFGHHPLRSWEIGRAAHKNAVRGQRRSP